MEEHERGCRWYDNTYDLRPWEGRSVEDGRGGRLRRASAPAPSHAMRRREADDVCPRGGATQPLRPNYEHRAPCPRPGRLPRAASPQVGRTPGISCEGRDLRWRLTAAATPWRLPPTKPRSSSNRPLSASSPCSAAAVTRPTCRRQPARTQPDRTPDSRQVPRPRNAEGVAWRARSASTPAWLRRPLEEPEEGLPFISGREPPRAADCTVSRRRPRRETEKRGCLCAKPRHEEAQSQ